MKKAQILIVSVLLAVGLIGCGKKEKTEPKTTEAVSQESEREYGKDCMGVFTISINPEVDLEIDKEGNISSVIFQNEDAKAAYEKLNLEGIKAEDAVKLIVKTADEKGYLKDDGKVTLVYGTTGNASAEEALGMIEGARDAVMDTLNDLGKESAVNLGGRDIWCQQVCYTCGSDDIERFRN